VSPQLQRGQVLVEFTLAASLLFVLIFGLIDFSRALFAYDQVTAAARIGSRYAIVHGTACAVAGCPSTQTSVQAYVRSKVTGLNTASLNVNPVYSTAPGCTDPNWQGPLCIVTVTVTYPFSFVLGYVHPIQMSSSSQMVISQ
jgi:Flp pilus assembly protein TadG